MNTLALSTISKLNTIKLRVIEGSGQFGDLIEYQDNQIDLVINHEHDKEIIIGLIDVSIEVLSQYTNAHIMPSSFKIKEIDSPEYMMQINFIEGEKLVNAEFNLLPLLN